MRDMCREQERLQSLVADLEEAVTDLEHLLSIAAIRRDDYRRELYEDELGSLRDDLEAAESELQDIEARLDDIDRADFERMTM